MIYLQLAVLNLWKYRRRTLVIIAGVLISVMVMELVAGMLNGMRRTFFSDMLDESGHLQIHAEGWEQRLDRHSLEYLIADPDEIVAILSDVPAVVRAEKILGFEAIVGRAGSTLPVIGRGVSPHTTFFADATGNVVEGTFLQDDAGGMVVSRNDAELLGLGMDDAATILIRTRTGVPVLRRVPISGIYDSDHGEIGAGTFFMRHADAARLLGIGDRTNEIRVMLDDPRSAEDVVATVEPALRAHQVGIRTWREIHGSLIVFVDVADLTAAIINAFVLIVAASVITNAILMTAFDRIGTFGALRAIGMKRRQLIMMVVSEGAIIGIAGSALGMAVAVPVVLSLQEHGLPIGELARFLGTGQTYYFSFELFSSVRTFAYGVLIACLSALYAGWVTARLDLIRSLQEA